MEVTVLQTQKIQALETKLEQQLPDIATSSGSSITGQISATIDTSTSGGSITSYYCYKRRNDADICQIHTKLPARTM